VKEGRSTFKLWRSNIYKEEENYIIPATSGLSDDLYTRQCGTRVSDTRHDTRIVWIW
jgi:hypothetical protein